MMTIIWTGIILGDIALWLDFGNRMFGSYVRTPFGMAGRLTIAVLLLLLLPAPAIWQWIEPSSSVAADLSILHSVLGFLLFIHFLFPYRWGIRRVTDNLTTTRRMLTKDIELAETEVTLPTLPAAADGLSCLLLSDVHCNHADKLESIAEALGVLPTPPADLVFLLGDFGENKALLPQVIATLTRIRGRLGTYAVLGNHDYEGGRREQITALLEAQSVRLLSDECLEISTLGVSLIGMAYPWIRKRRDFAPPAGWGIVLTHTPDNLLYLSRIGAQVAFAGHTHGGKLRIPGLGAVLVPSRLGRFLDQGWFRCGRTLLYLTRGIGYFPGRGGTAGEISRVIFRRGPGIGNRHAQK